jgi:hypothetical protein
MTKRERTSLCGTHCDSSPKPVCLSRQPK